MFPQRIWLGCLRHLAPSSRGRLAYATCEAPPQYDVSEKMKNLFELKQKQRAASRAYFRKIIMNPYRSKVDTVPFDPVLFRYNALMTYHDEYLDLDARNIALFVAFYIMPIFLTYWGFNYFRDKREKQYRAGEISPRNRARLYL